MTILPSILSLAYTLCVHIDLEKMMSTSPLSKQHTLHPKLYYTDEAASTWIANEGVVEATAMEEQRIWVIDKGGTVAAAMDHLEERKKLVKIYGKSESVGVCAKGAVVHGHEFLKKIQFPICYIGV